MNNFAKYALRAVKYFLYISLIVTAVIAVLVAAGLLEGDINTLFIGGWNSVVKILIVFALVSMLYPMLGYVKMNAHIHGEWNSYKGEIVSYMDSRGYSLEAEEDGYMSFRHRGVASKAKRMFEDRVTMVWTDFGVKVEGLRRDVVRIVGGLEYKFSENSSL